ncbi:MAG: phosphatidylserine decarboxylase [Pyrinomonadaceae bacterium]
MVRAGFPYIFIPLLLGGIIFFTPAWPLAIIPIGLAVFMAFFFRDPDRLVPSDPDIIVSPADGRVTTVAKLDAGDPQSPTLLSIFLSPFDVHINRAPIAGEIDSVVYTRGKFLMATNSRSSLVNEQNALTIRGDKMTVVCKQIAGILARRIVCWKHAGQEVRLGERFGMIKFSSRTDLILPHEVEITVRVGAKVRGGVTIVGRLVR